MTPNAVARYIEGLTIGQGRHVGQPFALLPWQRRFVRRAFRPGVSSAALTMGRGNGKTAFCAALATPAVDVDGPLVAPNATAVIVASSFEQGKIAFRHILHFLTPSRERWPTRFRVTDHSNRAEVLDTRTGAHLRVLGSDPRRLHGLAVSLVLADEVAQWPQPERMIAALQTGMGKLPEARMLWIGTRPVSPEHPFAKALDEKERP